MDTIEIFPWNKGFETGVLEIDEQNRQLVALINVLAGHLASQSEPSSLKSVCLKLSEYSEYSLNNEEAIWKQHLHDDIFLEHRKKHINFRSDLSKLIGDPYRKPTKEIIFEILSILTDWLMFHVVESDGYLAMMLQANEFGLSREEAKKYAESEINSGSKMLINVLLAMYESLAGKLQKEISERRKVETNLLLSAYVFENTLDAICITDADANIIDINPAFCRISELSREKLLGKNLKAVMSALDDQSFSESLWDVMTKEGSWSGEIQDCKSGGELQTEWLTLSSIRDGRGAIINYVAVFSNVSELLQRQQKLERIANHDPLTNLPNRILLMDRLDRAIAFAKRTGEMLAICYLDLDGFKPINDQLGHDAGDKVLCAVSSRIKNVVRDNDTAARLGGDEFVLLLGQIKSEEDCRIILDRLLYDLAQPIQVDGDYARVTASIGVSMFPDDGLEVGALLKHADKAMYLAKNAGKSRYHFFSEASR